MSTNTQAVQLSNVTVERGEDGLVTLQIEVAPESVQIMRGKVIKEYSRRIRVPGFRPGHIPPNIVRRNVGDESIAQQVSDELVPLAYQQALEQTELQPLERAQVDQLTFDAFDGMQPLNFTARVIVRPTIELGQTEGLTVEKPHLEVTEDDIDAGIEALRTERATLQDVTGRGAQAGDVVSAELQVFIDNQARTEEPTRLRAFILGESGFIPHIDEPLLGAELDEERRFAVTYPADFNDAELAGQDAEFAIKVTSLKERVLPEVNDELAGAMGVDDVAALRERMKLFIGQNQVREALDAMRGQIVDGVTNSSTFEVPASLVTNRMQQRVHNLEHELEHREATMEQYLADTGQTREEFDAQLRAELEAELKRELVLDEIALREEIGVTNEEVEDHYMRLAAALRQPIEKVVEQFDVNSVRSSILQRKAVDWLMSRSVIVDENGNPVAAANVEAPGMEATPEAEAAKTTEVQTAEATVPATAEA